MKMRKTLAMLSALVMAMSMASCSDGGDTSTAETNASTAVSAASAAPAQKLDLEGFSVAVPSGWVSVPSSDKTSVSLYKTNDANMISGCNQITIAYKAKGKYMLLTGMFESYEEVKDLKAGNYTWNGAKGPYGGGKDLLSLNTTVGEGYLSTDIWTKVGENTISMSDADVKAIMDGITVNAAAETTAAETTAAAVTTEPINTNVEHKECKNSILQLKALYDLANVDGLTLVDSSAKDEYTAVSNYSYTNKDHIGQISVSVLFTPMSADHKKNLDEGKNTGKDFVKTDLGGSCESFVKKIENSNGTHRQEVYFVGGSYLDGYLSIRFTVDPVNGSDDATADMIVKTIAGSLKFEGSDAAVRTADGFSLAFENVTFRNKATVAGKEIALNATVATNVLHAAADFTADGISYHFETGEQRDKASFGKLGGGEYADTTFAGKPGKVKLKSGTGSIIAEGDVLFDDAHIIHFKLETASALRQAEFSDAAKLTEKLKDMMKDENKADTQKKLAGYMSEILSAFSFAGASSAAETTTTAATTAAATTTTAAQTTKSNGTALSDQDLEFYARRYYGLHHNYSPEYVAVQHDSDGKVNIQLYDGQAENDTTCDWYTVDPVTGKGEDLMGNPIDILDESSELWMPEKDIYGVNDGEFARILYLGKMKAGSELNPMTLQTLIGDGSETAAREYVNHYPYINSIPENNMFSSTDGEYVFMIIPADIDAKIRIDVNDVYGGGMRTLTRSYNSAPVILRCNKGGKTDTKIYITDQRGEHSFSPKKGDGWSTDCGGAKVEDLAFPFG
ncbi:MAG: hypothetical protein IK130_00275 [Oscillospiraceae bacterium]|nr:hypothetical protein [Oscillospiraceae bacterium]